MAGNVSGGSNPSSATFPLKFNKVLTIVGTLYSLYNSSEHNFDDNYSYTTTGVRFSYHPHKYIAVGV